MTAETTDEPAPPASDEVWETPAVDIHKVKPVHSWREFWGEVGIIVIGVLMALTGEQVVEWLHWQEKVAQAHHALQGELTDVYQSSAERIVERPCLDAQLDILKQRLLSSGTTLHPAPLTPSVFGPTVFRHSSREWDDTIWQSVITEQVGSHFGEDERQEYASLYNTIADMRRLNLEEDADDGPLRVLASPLPLDPGLRGHLLEAIETERQRADFMDLLAGQQMRWARDLVPGLVQSLQDPEWRRNVGNSRTTLSWCRAHRLPLAPMPMS